MSNDVQKAIGRPESPPAHPFRRALLRGLAVLCPPLLTILILVWAINTTKSYFLEPVTGWARDGLVWGLQDVRTDLHPSADGIAQADNGRLYHQVPNRDFHPAAGLRNGAERGERAAAQHWRGLLSRLCRLDLPPALLNHSVLLGPFYFGVVLAWQVYGCRNRRLLWRAVRADGVAPAGRSGSMAPSSRSPISFSPNASSKSRGS